MSRILILPGDKTLFVIDHNMCRKQVSKGCLALENNPGFAQLGLGMLRSNINNAQFLNLFVGDTGHATAGYQ